jgi:hypothetical protein
MRRLEASREYKVGAQNTPNKRGEMAGRSLGSGLLILRSSSARNSALSFNPLVKIGERRKP